MFLNENSFEAWQGTPIEFKGIGVSKSFAQSFSENWDFQRYTRNSDSRQQNLHDEFDTLIDEIKQNTGTELDNPFRSGWGEFIADNASYAKDMLLGFPDPTDPDSKYREDNKRIAEQQRVEEFYKKADKLRETSSGMPYRSFEQIEERIKNRAHELQGQLNDGRISGLGASMLGAAAGGMTDPVNATVTLLTGGVGAAKTSLMSALGRVALWEGTANALSEAVVQFSEGGVFDYNQELGLDYSKSEALANVGMAAAGGAVFGAGMTAAGYTAKSILKRLKTAKSKGFKLNPSEEATAGIFEEKVALDDYMAATSPYGDNPRGQYLHTQAFLTERKRMLSEQSQLMAAVEEVTANPRGPKSDPIVHIKPSDMSGVIVERGEYLPVTGTGSKSGYGLVKFIWKHGEKGHDKTPVMRGDITDFPRIIREYEPMSNERYGDNRIWSVQRKDGTQVVYADKDFNQNGVRRLVSIHIVTDPKHAFYGKFSPKKEARPGSFEHTPDTDAKAYYRQEQSAVSKETAIREPRFQDGGREDLSNIITPDVENVNRTLFNYSPEELAEIEKLVDAHALELPDSDIDGAVKSVNAREAWDGLKQEKTAVDEITACITEFNL